MLRRTEVDLRLPYRGLPVGAIMGSRKAFEESFAATYGGTSEQMVQAWAVAAQQERRRQR